MAIDFNTEPYFDDYSGLKDFYRILFRPSYAVQARELTQLQTILQNQVSRFGDHTFKNGSQVIPGSVNVDNKVHFIKLEQFTGTIDVTTYIESFKNKIITGETSGVSMRVVDTSSGGAVVEDLSYPTLYCKVEGTADDTSTNRLLPGENLIAYVADNLVSTNFRLEEDQLSDINAVVRLTGNQGETSTTYTGDESSDVLGYGFSVDVQAGIYYVDGLFVRNDDLKLYVGRFNNTPSCRVGFKVTEETVSPEDDETILDNATGSYNFAAPGAHRYKVSLSLVKLNLTGDDSIKFIELVRVVDGRVQQKVTTTSYAELEKTLARRTYDESGNYEVNKFKLSVREHLNDNVNQGVYAPYLDGTTFIEGTTYGDEDQFVLVVDPGKAYIQGYEVESTSAQFIDFQKARVIDGDEGNHVRRIPEQTVGLNLGNYVTVDNLYDTPDITTFEKVYLVNTPQKRIASVQVVVSVTGHVTSVIIQDGGSGYINGSFTTDTAIHPITSVVPADARLVVTVVNGSVDTIVVQNAGGNYDDTLVPLCILDENLYVDSTGNAINGGNTPATSEIVGTARARSFQMSDFDDIYTSTKYKLGLFDIQMIGSNAFDRDVKSVVAIGQGLSFAANITPFLNQIPGTSTSSTATNQIVGNGTLYTLYTKIGDIIYINNIEVGTVASVENDWNLTLTTLASSTQSSGRSTIFTTVLNDPEFETLLFPLSHSYVKTLRGFNAGADTEKLTDITVRRQWPSRAASSNRVFFDITNSDETLLSDEDLSNYTLINADTNVPVKVTTNSTLECYITFNNDTIRKTVYFWNVPAGNYYLIASVAKVAADAVEKTKVLDKVNGIQTIQGITNKRTISSPSIKLSHGDIFELVSIEMTPTADYVFDVNNTIDITDRYTLDNGQRPTYYTYGNVNLKPGMPAPTGAIRITYHFFSYSTLSEGNYFSVDSYTTSATGAVDYKDIPSYFITDKETGAKVEVNLSDVIDFRPVLTTTNSFYPELPKIGSDLISPIAHYVGRTDLISVDSFGKFNIIKGVPSQEPQTPDEPKEGMVLATVNVPPYTRSISEVSINQKDNRRYTMRDIGKLERRITNLEYYVSLSLLEKDTAQMQIKDAETGLDAFKNGFIVDQFSGHSIGNVKEEDYRCAIDASNKILRPMHYTNDLTVVEDLSSGTERGNKNYQKTNDLITLPFDTSPYIFNNNATRTMDIHALSMGAFQGQIELYPVNDNWKSVTRRPDLVAVDDNNYDAIKYLAAETGVTGTAWNEWESHWASAPSSAKKNFQRIRGDVVTGYEETTKTWSGYQTRSGLNTEASSTVNAQDYGDRIVDISYIPFIRSRPVTYIAKNLKNATRFYPFFDSTPVDTFVKPADIFKVSRVSTSLMSFDYGDLQNNVLQDQPERSFDGITLSGRTGNSGGNIEPAFANGDVLSNTTHIPTNIVSITHLTSPAATFTFVVNDSSGIRPGNHIMFFNMDYHNTINLELYNDYSNNENVVGTTSSGIIDPTNSSHQLNLKAFKVTSVVGGSVTVENLDGSDIEAFDPYLTASYTDPSRGRVYRLRASGVATAGYTYSSDSIGPIQQDIYLTNVKNGFAVDETLSGSAYIGTAGSFNAVTVDEINGSNLINSAPPMMGIADSIITDTTGTAVGVFYIPETDELSFRTGERAFKLTDNLSNSNASFDSIGSATYYAQGITLDRERTVVSSRSTEFVQAATYEDSRELGLPALRRSTTTTRITYQYTYDPLAQTFTINSPGGVFATSLDLYFQESGRRPISIELRPTINGVPSSTKVIPFSRVTKITTEVNTSDDATGMTRFTFASPVYLQDAETYSFVIMTDEPGAQVWVSEMGREDITSGNTIAGQPLTGSLYASQNAKEWEIQTLIDTKFSLNTAKFSTGTVSELTMRALPPANITLPKDPFYLITPAAEGDPMYIRVSAPMHGLLAGQNVTISSVSSNIGSVDGTTGIPNTLLNTTHTIMSAGLEKDYFMINLVTAEAGTGNSLLIGNKVDLVTGKYGSVGVSCTRGFAMDKVFIKTSDMVFSDTSINYYVQATAEDGSLTGWLPIIANSNYQFDERMNATTLDNINTSSSLQIKAYLQSSNPNISPVIDLGKISAYSIANLINTPNNSVINVPEFDTRVLIESGDVLFADTESTITGTVTAATNTTAVTGTNTLFLSEIFPGDILYNANTNLLGTVSSVTDDTTLILTAPSSTAATGVSAYVRSPADLVFVNNADGFGTIKTSVDVADNILSTVGIGKYLTIAGAVTGVDGTYLVRDIVSIEDKDVYGGNTEYDAITVILESAFTASVTVDMVNDANFVISILDRYSNDTAPYGSSTLANYITRTLSLTESATRLKVMFDANINNGSSIEVYYRTWLGNGDVRKLRWIDTGFVSTDQDRSGQFLERGFDLTDLAAFNNVQIKIVMKTSNPVVVPLIKNLRALALS